MAFYIPRPRRSGRGNWSWGYEIPSVPGVSISLPGSKLLQRSLMSFERKDLTQKHLSNDQLIEEVTRRLAAAAPGAKVILFGSRSRGEGRPNSDLDLLVIHRGEVESPGEEFVRLRRELRGLGVGVDLLVVSAEYAERRARSAGSLMEEVLSRGRVLVDA
jgi:uncharacterized protein